MKIPNLREFKWFSPENLGGENISSIMKRYIKINGWKEGDNPVVIYSGSESQLEKGIEEHLKNPFIPFIMNFWGWMPERFLEREWREHYLNKIKLIEEHVDLITVPSNLAAEQLMLLGVTKEMVIVPPGVDTAFILSCKMSSRRYIDPDPYVISVGRLVLHKNFKIVIEALKGLNYKYIIVGDGQEKENLEKIARENGVTLLIKNNITDEDKFELMALAKCVIVSSEYEGFCLPIIEGVSIGTPVIAKELPLYSQLFDNVVETYTTKSELHSKIKLAVENELYRKEVILKEAILGLKFSAFIRSLELEKSFIDIISRKLKDSMRNEIFTGHNTMEDAYNLDALVDREYFKYRLDPNNELFSYRSSPLIETLIPGKVLDAGSSTGVFACHMANAGFEVTCVDISEEYLRIAKELMESNGFVGRYFKADITDLKMFNNEEFENVWAGEILEHFIEPQPIIKELVRVLKPGGRILLTVPYGDACFDPFHFARFNTEKDIRNLFKNFPEIEIMEIKKVGARGGAHNNWFAWGTKK